MSYINVAGKWKSLGNGVEMEIQQDGTKISSSFASPEFAHKLVGELNSTRGYFDYTVARKSVKTGCETVMTGRLRFWNETQLATDVEGTDGRCDLPADFKEHLIWSRS